MKAQKAKVALGFSVHTGWAGMTAVSESAGGVAVVSRRRIDIIRGSDPDHPPFVYHAARSLPAAEAARFVEEFAALSLSQAKAALRGIVEELSASGFDVVAGGIPSGRAPSSKSLPAILANHALVHAAEGELYRGAIRQAAESLDVEVIQLPVRELQARASKVLHFDPGQLERHLREVGRSAGPPWAKDQKDGYLAARIALCLEAS